MSGTVRRDRAGTGAGTGADVVRLRRGGRWWRRALAAGAGLAVAAVMAWLVLVSPVLAVDTVDVSGNQALTRAQVLAAADVPPGVPLARADTAAVAQRVAALPQVSRVAVVRRWPRTLAVLVEERVAVAAIRADDRVLLVDRAGVAFARADRPPAGTPVLRVTGLDRTRAMRAALDVVVSLPDPLRRSVRRVTASTTDDVTLDLTRDRQVVWGSPDRAARKALVLQALLRRPADVYDVSAPNTPTTR